MRRRRKWPWILALCLGIPAILLLIAQDQETVVVASPIAATDARFTAYVASLVGTPTS